MMQMFSFHTHTDFSDGHNSVEEMLSRAKELGWEKIGISDHLIVHKNIRQSISWPLWRQSPNLKVYRQDFSSAAEDFSRHAEHVRQAAKNCGIKAFVGAEVDFFTYSGWEEEFAEFRRRTELDYYISGNHFLEPEGDDLVFRDLHCNWPDFAFLSRHQRKDLLLGTGNRCPGLRGGKACELEPVKTCGIPGERGGGLGGDPGARRPGVLPAAGVGSLLPSHDPGIPADSGRGGEASPGAGSVSAENAVFRHGASVGGPSAAFGDCAGSQSLRRHEDGYLSLRRFPSSGRDQRPGAGALLEQVKVPLFPCKNIPPGGLRRFPLLGIISDIPGEDREEFACKKSREDAG